MKGALLAAVVLSACTALKPGGDHADAAVEALDVVDAVDALADGDGPAVDACWDPAGFGGRGCWSCEATTQEQILNACPAGPAGSCVVFDTAALPPRLDGSVPPLPVDAGPLVGSCPRGPADAGADAADAPALPACASLTGASVVYATGSSAARPLLARLAQAFAGGASPFTLAYRASSSCEGVSAMRSPVGNMLTGTMEYWEPGSATARLCGLPPAGVAADVGVSDVFFATCAGSTGAMPSDLGDFRGPVQVMGFAVPQTSRARSISSSAAYLAFGFGARSNVVAPWSDPCWVLQRGASSGTQALVAEMIGVPRDRWLGAPAATSDAMAGLLRAGGALGVDIASRALGVLSAAQVRDHVDALRFLAYQQSGQRCGFLPDATESARDQRNVRDGRYPLFGPVHLFARTTAAGAPRVSGVRALIEAVQGVTQRPGLDLFSLYADLRLVPQCAMRVQRAADGAALSALRPERPCYCYFDLVTTGTTACTPCASSADCPAAAPTCVMNGAPPRGFCER